MWVQSRHLAIQRRSTSCFTFVQDSICKRKAGVALSRVGDFDALDAGMDDATPDRDVAHRKNFCLIPESSSRNTGIGGCEEKIVQVRG